VYTVCERDEHIAACALRSSTRATGIGTTSALHPHTIVVSLRETRQHAPAKAADDSSVSGIVRPYPFVADLFIAEKDARACHDAPVADKAGRGVEYLQRVEEESEQKNMSKQKNGTNKRSEQRTTGEARRRQERCHGMAHAERCDAETVVDFDSSKWLTRVTIAVTVTGAAVRERTKRGSAPTQTRRKPIHSRSDVAMSSERHT